MSPEKRVLEDGNSEQETKKLKESQEEATEIVTANHDNGEKEDTDSKKKISTEAGTVVFAGCLNYNAVGRKIQVANSQSHYLHRRIKALADVRVARVVSHGCAVHHIIISDEGKVYMFGRNEKGQLGVGDTKERAGVVMPGGLDDVVVVNGAVGRHHSLFLTDQGHVYACGENKSGQCGLGHCNPVLTPVKINLGIRATKVACGGEFSVILTEVGDLYSFGLPEYGQLGHNTDGKYFVTTSKLSFHFETAPKRIPLYVEKAKNSPPMPFRDVRIVDVACGNNHTVALDSNKRLFTWGFGGYGRLGHSETKDEMIPRLVKFFDRPTAGVTKCYAGSSFSICESKMGIFMFGQTKKTGEANMYPKPIQDLYGWNVRDIGCSNTSIMVAADDTVIAWGPSPTYGELGLGEHTKSSTTPKEVKSLDGAHVYRLSCSMASSLLVVRDETENDKKILAKLKEISF